MDGSQIASDDLVGRLRDAQASRDWPRAVRLAAELRQRAPAQHAGYRIGGIALRELKQLTESWVVLTEARALFPAEAWPLTESAHTAKAAGDKREALRLVGELITRFPGQPAGYRIAAMIAREVKRFDEAEEILVEARARFPAADWAWGESAYAAIQRGMPQQAMDYGAELRRLFPGNPGGYETASIAARSLRRFDEATNIAAAAARKFPRAVWPLIELAWNARAGGDMPAAIGHAAELRRRFPDHSAGYQLGCRFLRRQERFDEAQAVAAAAKLHFPKQVWPDGDLADTLRIRENRAAALRLDAVLNASEKMTGPAALVPEGGKVVVILGMHRAGTSLCTRIISRLGIPLGTNLAQPGFDNPDGYFENNDIVACHQDLLAAMGADWDTVRFVQQVPADFWQSEPVVATVKRLRGVVAAQLRASGGVWAFKDPRTACFLPLWRRIFDELGIQPVWLLAVRNPGHVAASLQSRDNIPAAQSALLWLEHYLAALRHVGPDIAGIVHYEDWLADPAPQLQRLAEALGSVDAGMIGQAASVIKMGPRPGIAAPAAPAMALANKVHGWLRDEKPAFWRLRTSARTLTRELRHLASGNQMIDRSVALAEAGGVAERVL